MTAILRKIRKYAFQGEIIMCLAVASFMVKFIPFRLIKFSLGNIGTDHEYESSKTLSAQETRRLSMIGRHIEIMAHRVPFSALCLPQAMTGYWMLSRRGIKSRISIGARSSQQNPPIDLHAWLTSGQICVTGEGERLSFQEFRSTSSKSSDEHVR